MTVLFYILVALEVIASIALVIVVLMQSGKEDGLGAIAGKTDTYMGKNQTSSIDRLAAKSTKWIALVWILLALALSLF